MTSTDDLNTHGFTRKPTKFNLVAAIDRLAKMGLGTVLLAPEEIFTREENGQTSEFRTVIFTIDRDARRKVALVIQDEVYVSFVPVAGSDGLDEYEVEFLFWAISSAMFFMTNSQYVPVLCNPVIEPTQVPINEETPLDVRQQIDVQQHSRQFKYR